MPNSSNKPTWYKVKPTKQEPIPCKCGNFPKVGDIFYYRSRYGEVIGEVGSAGGNGIISTRGASYPNAEIELKPKDIIREEKLNDIGI
jgi:hypothetical protein